MNIITKKYLLISYRYNHAITLTNGSTASEEGDNEDNRAQSYKKRRYGEEAIVEEVLIFMVYAMDDRANR